MNQSKPIIYSGEIFALHRQSEILGAQRADSGSACNNSQEQIVSVSVRLVLPVHLLGDPVVNVQDSFGAL